MNWLILRVFAGLPLNVERTINDMGVPAYCPAETIKRRHPRGKHIIVQRKPLLPGYVFVAANEDWNTSPITLTPALPLDALLTTRVKARWLQLASRLCFITQGQMDDLHAMEQAWRPGLEDYLHALQEISRGTKPKSRFINFTDWKLANEGQCVTSPHGRAA